MAKQDVRGVEVKGHPLQLREMYMESATLIYDKKANTERVLMTARNRADIEQPSAGRYPEVFKYKDKDGYTRENNSTKLSVENYNRLMDKVGYEGAKVPEGTKIPLNKDGTPHKGKSSVNLVGADTPDNERPTFVAATKGMVRVPGGAPRQAAKGEMGEFFRLATNVMDKSQINVPFNKQRNLDGIKAITRERIEKNKSLEAEREKQAAEKQAPEKESQDLDLQ